MLLREAYWKLNGVRDEFGAAKFALRKALSEYRLNLPAAEADQGKQVTLHDLESCTANLEITFLVRLFAEFESIVRDYWSVGLKRVTRPPMMDLLNSVAAYCSMSNDDVEDAHEVRDYRNLVIHERLQDPRFDFQTCRSRLARFLRWLPQTW